MLIEGDPETIVVGESRNVGLLYWKSAGLFKKVWMGTVHVPIQDGSSRTIDAYAGANPWGKGTDNFGNPVTVYATKKDVCLAILETLAMESQISA